MDFVLGNSVAMRWQLQSSKASDQRYAMQVLASLEDAKAVVPSLWHLEAANVLVAARQRGELAASALDHFIAQLECLPISVDSLTAQQAFSRTLTLAQTYKLSSYDAAYLELAIREGLPLATLDKDLLAAARKADVKAYQPGK